MKFTTYSQSFRSFCFLIPLATYGTILYHDPFDGDGLGTNEGIGGGAVSRTLADSSWVDNGNASYETTGTADESRALLYSANTFQADTGFRLRVSYEPNRLSGSGGHALSFGLISSDTDLSSFDGGNPFGVETGVYSIGANVTSIAGATAQGLNFSDGSTPTTLDQSGTRVQFQAGQTCSVEIEIGVGGYWCYRIDGAYEASGILLEGFDLSKDYRIVVYGQGNSAAGTSIRSIAMLSGYAPGERARSLRGSWNAGQGDTPNIKDFKTIDSTLARLNEGSVVSAEHNAPNKTLERIALGLSPVGGSPINPPVPTWGDLSQDEPAFDPFLEDITEIRAAGIGVKVYSNAECFIGDNAGELQPFVTRWIAYCDNDPEIQAFINSQPYHTGVWNRATEQYEVAFNNNGSETYPFRKYIFCYIEFVLKEYALRYGSIVSSWTFDSATDIEANGDNPDDGILEEQRIFQAFANAVHAGNPEIPIAFNNGRLSNDLINDPSFPYARPTRFDDYTFGHAFNGNSDHASDAINPTRNESVFDSNYRHVSKMTEKNGYVHAGGEWDWDDQIVGNYHSKLGPQSWRFSTPSAWEQDEFNQWNLEAMQAGGHMTWEGSIPRNSPILRDWAIELLRQCDEFLAVYQTPNTPSWARKYTDLPQANSGQNYYHVLTEGEDFWDPEGDDITSITPVSSGYFSQVPSWLTISEDPNQPGQWIFSGTPSVNSATTLHFSLMATDENGYSGTREVELLINKNDIESWYDFPVTSDANGNRWADTGEWLGWILIEFNPYVWSLSLGTWIFVDNLAPDGRGDWVYLFN